MHKAVDVEATAMHVPSLGTPEGAFDYLMIVLLVTTVVFGLFFGALELGMF